jgi:hypothetical protein
MEVLKTAQEMWILQYMSSIIGVNLIYLTHFFDLQHPYKDGKPLIFISI